jgi:hypothetical protein
VTPATGWILVSKNRKADSNNFDVVVRDDAPEFGDASVGMTYEYNRDSGPQLVARIDGLPDRPGID